MNKLTSAILIIASLVVTVIVSMVNYNHTSLDDNQTTLYYMYSNDEGHYFLDPNQEYENVIYVSLDDTYLDESVHHGDTFIGTFEDDTLWELVSIIKE